MSVDRSLAIPSNYTICTSSTRPANPRAGQMIYEANTKNFYIYDGSTWALVKSADLNVEESNVQTWV